MSLRFRYWLCGLPLSGACMGFKDEAIETYPQSSDFDPSYEDCVPPSEHNPLDITQQGVPCSEDTGEGSDGSAGSDGGSGSDGTEDSADLRVSGLVVEVVDPAPGADAHFWVTLSNRGASDAGMPQIRLFFSEDSDWDSGDESAGIVDFGANLSAGDEKERDFWVSLPSETGTFHAGIYVDPRDRIDESNENNNERTTSSVIELETEGLADLDVATVEFAPSSLVSGDTLAIEAELLNRGDADTSRYYSVGYWASPSGDPTVDGTLLCASRVSEHEAGRTVTTSEGCVVSLAPGSYYLVVTADQDGVIEEENESNNSGGPSTRFSVTAPTSPNLTASGSLRWDTSTIGVSEFASTSLTVTNSGTASSGSFSVDYYLSSNTTLGSSDVLIDSVSLSSISPGSSRTADWAGTIPEASAGNYYVLAVIDPDADVSESDEADNLVVSTGTAELLPNVEPTVVDLTTSLAYVGDPVPIELYWETSGGTISRVDVDIYFSTNATISASDSLAYSGYWTSPSAGSHFTSFTSTSIPSSITGGWYYAGVILDEPDTIDEYNESDNKEASSSMFFLVNPEVEATPSSAYTGDTIRENGQGFTPGGTVDLYFQAPGSSYALCCSYVADSNGEYNHAYVVTSSTARGTWRYYAVDRSSGLASSSVSFRIY